MQRILAGITAMIYLVGIIPARAGFTDHVPPGAAPGRDHPRSDIDIKEKYAPMLFAINTTSLYFEKISIKYF